MNRVSHLFSACTFTLLSTLYRTSLSTWFGYLALAGDHRTVRQNIRRESHTYSLSFARMTTRLCPNKTIMRHHKEK